MIILSHRGCWNEVSEKNSLIAFRRSFSLGFGTETDFRDYNGELVISHDIGNELSMTAEDFFQIYIHTKINELPLALNIKADGLQVKLKELLDKYYIENYFVFDMSIPDTLGYIKHNIKSFTRQSEYEPEPSFYDDAAGVWLDEFHSHWITRDVIAQHIQNNKQICIVSPDLHKREYRKEWQHYKEIEQELGVDNLMLCTDHPQKAKEFFDE